MAVQLLTPHKFRERLLLMGGGGAGKSSAALSIISSAQTGHMYVVDNDYSAAYQRALETDFEDAEGKVTIVEAFPDWEGFISAVEQVVGDKQANVADNWLDIDSVSPSWDYVQSWYSGFAMGADLGQHMAQLRKDSGSVKEYQASLAESMNWPAVKKEYARIYRAIQGWKGHLILTAEAKGIGGNERDEQLKALYGPVGFKPVGEGRLHHVTSTTLFLKQDSTGYKFSTVKDRNRSKVMNQRVDQLDEGGFAMSYLREIAGWQVARRRKQAEDVAS